MSTTRGRARQQRTQRQITSAALPGGLLLRHLMALLAQQASSVGPTTYYRWMLGEIHPRAYAHLVAAHSARTSLLERWSEILDEGIVDVSVSCGSDGIGAIAVHAAWPDGSRERLTELFQEVVDRLWDCLDSLIEESVEMFSVRQRVRDPQQPRFFPVADSDEGLADLLAASCLDGILRAQYRLIRCVSRTTDPTPTHAYRIFVRGCVGFWPGRWRSLMATGWAAWSPPAARPSTWPRQRRWSP